MVPAIEQQIGVSLTRLIADKGYRGHNAPPARRRSVFISGQKRGVTAVIRRELRRRAAVEPVIGHVKAEHRMGRNYLIGRHGDATNAILAAVGYNFRRLLAWLTALLCLLWTASIRGSAAVDTPDNSFALSLTHQSVSKTTFLLYMTVVSAIAGE